MLLEISDSQYCDIVITWFVHIFWNSITIIYCASLLFLYVRVSLALLFTILNISCWRTHHFFDISLLLHYVLVWELCKTLFKFNNWVKLKNFDTKYNLILLALSCLE